MKKKIYLLVSLCLFFVFACEKEALTTLTDDTSSIEEETVINEEDDLAKRSCATSEMNQKSLRENPELISKREKINRIADNYSEKGIEEKIYTIPVIIHVIYNENRPSDNISERQIQHQINILNKDFRKTNKDISKVPDIFKNRAADVKINFVLDSIIRKETKVNTFTFSDNMKFASRGGSNAIKPLTYLNIWVCRMFNSLLGFAYLPGSAPTNRVDGVVVSTHAFGAGGTAERPFNKGRTTTHEIGHFFNLEHIWGPETGYFNDPYKCSNGDMVGDTPISLRPHIGGPVYPSSSCGSIDMTMNYMDYTSDNHMYMFTKGQKKRMRATFLPGGGRESFAK